MLQTMGDIIVPLPLSSGTRNSDSSARTASSALPKAVIDIPDFQDSPAHVNGGDNLKVHKLAKDLW